VTYQRRDQGACSIMNTTNYYGVRKVAWDMLWHALYVVNGRETWDRVSRSKARRIEKNL
jgi:hypothetical protein